MTLELLRFTIACGRSRRMPRGLHRVCKAMDGGSIHHSAARRPACWVAPCMLSVKTAQAVVSISQSPE